MDASVSRRRFDLGRENPGYPVDIKISPEAVFYGVLFCIAVLSAAGIAAAIIQVYRVASLNGDAAGDASAGFTGYGILRLFVLNEERNVPTFFSVFLLLSCCLALLVIYAQKRASSDQWASMWIALAVVFFGMALDEFAGMHELVSYKLHSYFDTSGWLRYAWVVPGAAFVVLFSGFYIKFLLSLPKPTSLLFILAGLLYVGGAVGMEIIGGKYDDLYGRHDMTYQILTVVEETLEMVGAAVFLFALLGYLSRGRPYLRVAIHPLR